MIDPKSVVDKTLLHNKVVPYSSKVAKYVYNRLLATGIIEEARRPTDVSDLAARGMDFKHALLEYVRRAHDDKDRTRARAMVHNLMDDPEFHTIGHLAFGVFLVNEQLYEAAYDFFVHAGVDRAKELCPGDYYQSFFSVDPEAATPDIDQFLNSNRDNVTPMIRMELMKVLAKYNRLALMRREVPLFVASKPSLGAENAQLLKWFNDKLHQDAGKPVVEPGTISIAVMDYKLLDRSRTSSNRGDYVQTLAALSNLVRFTDVEYVGDDDLARLLTELKDSVRPERRKSGVHAKVRPVALDRDFSHGRSYPDNTWLICNGWFMHRNFRGEIDFPFPDEVNPLFISFHVQDPGVLTDEVVEQLRAYEPIGCRDWTTLYRLRDFGVKAFFSGCMTTTVGQVLPRATTSGRKLADVEVGTGLRFPGWRTTQFEQIGDYVRDFNLVEGIRDAKAMLEGYQDFSRIVTSRLHCYLPCRSMGHEVIFEPRNRSDVRFEGLLDLDEQEFNAIRHGIEDKLETMLTAILRGASRDEAMALWREICADDVARAEAYAQNYPPAEQTTVNVPDVIATMKREKRVYGGENAAPNSVKLAFALDQNLKDELAMVLRSIADTLSRPAEIHVMCRGLDVAYYERLHRLFPQFEFHFYAFDHVDYGPNVRMLAHTSISTMDRLFLPELLDQHEKVLYLDIDIFVAHDLAPLYDLQLGENVVAGKRTKLRTWASLVRLVTRASLHLTPEKAWGLRRRMHATLKMQSRTFNAGVLLLNLAKMRSENFTQDFLYLVEFCAMNDQDVLNVYANDRIVELDAEWNSVPNQDYCADPRIIHWAGPNKPWKENYVLHKARFTQALARVLD